jgi:hypothetical protein
MGAVAGAISYDPSLQVIPSWLLYKLFIEIDAHEYFESEAVPELVVLRNQGRIRRCSENPTNPISIDQPFLDGSSIRQESL